MLPATPRMHAERNSACDFTTVVATPSVSAASGSWRTAASAYPKRETRIHAATPTAATSSASAAKYCCSIGGASGLTLAGAPPMLQQYFAALALLVAAVGVAAWIRVSRFGYALAAVRQDPDAAETLGVATTVVKSQALFLSACILGVAGSIYALHYLFISPDSVFGFSTAVSFVIMPIIGGLGTVTGPLIGAVVYTFIREQLAATLANADLLAFGVLLIAIVVFEPRGILGIADRIRALRKRPAVTVADG